jgi:hypothetical protein
MELKDTEVTHLWTGGLTIAEGAYFAKGYIKRAQVPSAVAKILELEHKDRLIWRVFNQYAVVSKKEAE